MPLLSRIFFVIFLLTACSKGMQKEENTPLPEVETPPSESVSQNLSFEEFLDAAHQAYQNRDFKNLTLLLKEYENRFSEEKQKQEILLLQGMHLLSEKDWEKSRAILEPLSKSANSDLKGRALFYLGELERFQNRLTAALPLYLKAHQYFPSDEIYSSLGDTYSQMGRWKDAIGYYQKVVSRNPKSTQDLFLLGAAYYKAKQLKSAEQTMRSVLKWDPKNKYAYQYLAHIAQDRGDLRNYYYNLSRGILLMKDYAAVSTLLENQNLVYKDGDLSAILISSFVRQKKSEDALKVYRRAIKENPSLAKTQDFQIFYGVLDLIPNQGKDAGKKYFQDLAKMYPNNFLVVSTYAEVVRSGRKDDPKLESIYLQSLYLEPSDTAIRYELAELYQTQQKMEMAQLEYGILYFYQDQKEEALESLLNLENKVPKFQNIQLFLYIGLLYQQKGEKNLAQQYYQKVLALDKRNAEALIALKQLNS